MPLVPFPELMCDAARGRYAVGYFESWNLESLLAAADAAEQVRSPVLLGFSGIYLPHPQRRTRENLRVYYAFAHEAATHLTVPACLVFNESPNVDWVHQAIELGFGLVMYSDDESSHQSQRSNLVEIVRRAHERGICVEAELDALPGVGGELKTTPHDLRLTDSAQAQEFVAQLGVDALAVNIGQLHLHGRKMVRLDLERLRELRRAVDIPLVLHGATSVNREDLRAAVEIGVQKINVGSALKRTYFETLRTACEEVGREYNPYQVMGSGLEGDVLTTARLALQNHIAEWMQLFGSAGKA
ncbi:MAG TPA: class II fructose-bisphosphate aldolase [Anaerolineae bacterium]|nr:class II fructose-bisphosphate aldolase [Anaerolineae bacterium]